MATFLGVLFGLTWPAGLLACLTWLAVAALGRISSASALVAAASAPLWLYLLDSRDALWLVVLLALAIFATHRANIARLLAGTEPRIGGRR
ncbi:MAG: hypothetical protein KatS3mg118_3610 [Paracoccaceae bacterium]|nr:MAG: hypothetical protein KatS3mg118_3610 [Paracoccaceae bacterium]